MRWIFFVLCLVTILPYSFTQQILAEATDVNAIHGKSSIAIGVVGESSGYIGVYGLSNSSQGVFGESDSKEGIYGRSISGNGVFGTSNTGQGVYGKSVDGYGIYATSTNNVGIIGFSASHSGIQGSSTNAFGIAGFSGFEAGVYGKSAAGPGARFEGGGGTAIEMVGVDSPWGQDADDCVIRDDRFKPGSDMILVTNDNLSIHLDDDNELAVTSHIFVQNGANTTIFDLDEGGNLSINLIGPEIQ